MINGPEERFSPRHSDIALASKLMPSVMLKNPEALSSNQLRRIADAFPDLPSLHGLQSDYELLVGKNGMKIKMLWGTISNFVDSLHWADNDLYPNIRMILFISAIRPSTTASNERSFSTLKRLKTYLRSTMTADRLNGLSLMNINQDIEIPAETIVDNFGRLGPHRLAFL